MILCGKIYGINKNSKARYITEIKMSEFILVKRFEQFGKQHLQVWAIIIASQKTLKYFRRRRSSSIKYDMKESSG